jgi:deoxyribonuclease IV
MKIGLHCSVRQGFAAAVRQAASLGCDAVQIFPFNPRGWRTRVYTPEDFAALKRECEKTGISPLIVHANYIPNLCSSRESIFQRSLEALKADIQRCEEMAADYLVVHLGAYSPEAGPEEGLKRAADALNQGLREHPGSVRVLIENVGGGQRRLGGRFEEIAALLGRVEHGDRLGVCFDTCHALAAGYDLHSKKGIQSTLEEFDRTIGLPRIHVIHVNDSRSPRGSHMDHHEHLGAGHIGPEGFRYFLNHPALAHCALILETPRDRPGADLENLVRLREYLKK